MVRQEIDAFVWELRKAKGYERVTIPHITKKDLYEKSGHWDKFSDELFKNKFARGPRVRHEANELPASHADL